MEAIMNYLILLNQLTIHEESDSINVGIEVVGKILPSENTAGDLLPKLNTYAGITPILLGVLIITIILMKRKRENNEKN
ncbi:hypothetical protein D920_02326 [Enterococcus faecalis 13-SD-W-01]|nr:hypothetical protein D920_02326 [Enterococcus faecalis 13-SD-W-01]